MGYAPIGITTYSRLRHLQQTIKSLRDNKLACKTDIFIFLDAPRPGDEKIVKSVRDYVYTIKGFKNLYVIERETNCLYQNFRSGLDQLLNEYGKCIFMEDDNLVSTSFLKNMNSGLDFYEYDKRIIAICGFNVPVIASNYPPYYKHDYYLSQFFCAAGFATWKDRNLLEMSRYDGAYNEIRENKTLYRKIKSRHPSLINELKRVSEGTLDASDYKITYNMLKNDLYIVKPILSNVKNIGHDGSGVHCESTNKFDKQKLSNLIVTYDMDVEYVNDIDMVWRDFFDRKAPLSKRIIDRLRRVFNARN